jgi:hypothetical protein
MISVSENFEASVPRGNSLDSRSEVFLTEERVAGSALPPKLSVELGERETWQLDHLSKLYVIVSLRTDSIL